MGGRGVSEGQVAGAIARWEAAMPHRPLSVNEIKTIESIAKHGGDFADLAGTPIGQVMMGIPGTDTGLARGGMIRRGGMALVGEQGPELVSLPGGSMVHPSGTGPGGGGVTNQFHFHGSVYGVEDLKEAVVEAVRDHAISGGFSGVFAEA